MQTTLAGGDRRRWDDCHRRLAALIAHLPRRRSVLHRPTAHFIQRRKKSHRIKGKGRRCLLGNGIDSIERTIYRQDGLKKRMTRRKDAWQNGCFEKMDIMVHNTQNHRPPKCSSNHPCRLMASDAASTEDLCLPFCSILILCLYPLIYRRRYRCCVGGKPWRHRRRFPCRYRHRYRHRLFYLWPTLKDKGHVFKKEIAIIVYKTYISIFNI